MVYKRLDSCTKCHSLYKIEKRTYKSKSNLKYKHYSKKNPFKYYTYFVFVCKCKTKRNKLIREDDKIEVIQCYTCGYCRPIHTHVYENYFGGNQKPFNTSNLFFICNSYSCKGYDNTIINKNKKKWSYVS